MQDFGSLDFEDIIYVSLALGIQQGLVNEVYPEMRAVDGCLNFVDKKAIILLVYEGELSEAHIEAMDSVECEALKALPTNYSIETKVAKVEPSEWYECQPDNWRYFRAFSKHQDIDLNSSIIRKIDILNATSLWNLEVG